jgi:hypothetical protein
MLQVVCRQLSGHPLVFLNECRTPAVDCVIDSSVYAAQRQMGWGSWASNASVQQPGCGGALTMLCAAVVHV